MSFVTEEIVSQPQCWREAAQLARDGVTRSVLPARGARVAVIGCGTSLYMAQACAALRETRGEGETDAWPASEFPFTRSYDPIVAITPSGPPREIIYVLERLPHDIVSTVITTGKDLPAAKLATHTV